MTKLILVPGLFAAQLLASIRVDVSVAALDDVPPSIVEKAMRETSRLFGKIGIQLHWETCETTDVCTSFSGYVIAVRSIRNPAKTADVLGMALLSAGRGNRALVFYPHVLDFARDAQLSRELVLAYTIAHELGHLITRTSHHSSGVMMARWDQTIANKMRQRNLHFSAEVSRALLERLASNVAPAATARAGMSSAFQR